MDKATCVVSSESIVIGILQCILIFSGSVSTSDPRGKRGDFVSQLPDYKGLRKSFKAWAAAQWPVVLEEGGDEGSPSHDGGPSDESPVVLEVGVEEGSSKCHSGPLDERLGAEEADIEEIFDATGAVPQDDMGTKTSQTEEQSESSNEVPPDDATEGPGSTSKHEAKATKKKQAKRKRTPEDEQEEKGKEVEEGGEILATEWKSSR